MEIEPRHIIISARFPEGYLQWINDCTAKLRERLPSEFDEGVDFAVVLGSGLNTFPDVLPLAKRVVIPEKEIGLPYYSSELTGHGSDIVAGVTHSGKKVLMRSRAIHPYMGNPLGEDTPYGRMSPMHLATGYIHVFDLLGVKNMILSYAVGGVGNPVWPGDPPEFPEIPALGVVSSDINFANPSVLQGSFEGLVHATRFPSLRESDDQLIDAFQRQLQAHGLPAAKEEFYCQSPSTSGYENRAQVSFLVQNGFRFAGMSASTEMESASIATGIKRILGIAVITNRILLLPKGGNEYMLKLRALLKEKMGMNIHLSDYDKAQLDKEGGYIVPGRFEMQFMEPGQLRKEFETSHEEVDMMGKRMAVKLQPVVSDLIETFSN